jgi:hypothetical protein
MSYPSTIRMGDCNLSVASSCTAEFQSIVWFNSQLLELLIFNPDSFIFPCWFLVLMSQLMMLSGSVESWWCIVVANVQTMIIGHRGFHSTLQPGLAVPHSKVWCQTEVKRRPEESSTESSFFHRRLTGWLTDWLKCCNLWEWRDRTEEFSGQALVPDKGFFSNSQNFRSCFWCMQYEHLLPIWNSLLYSLPDLVCVLMIPGSYAVFLVSGVQPMIMGKTFPMKSSHSQWLLTVAAGWHQVMLGFRVICTWSPYAWWLLLQIFRSFNCLLVNVCRERGLKYMYALSQNSKP